MIVACVQKIMKGECACQHVEEAEGVDEGAEEEAEQDEMLFEYAGEVLPTLGRALNPATFDPCFTGLLPMRIAIAIADSLEPLQGVLQPFLQHMLPLFVEMIKDSEDDFLERYRMNRRAFFSFFQYLSYNHNSSLKKWENFENVRKPEAETIFFQHTFWLVG